MLFLFVEVIIISKLNDLTGRKYGRLTVIEHAEDRAYSNGVKVVTWLCQCQCGNQILVPRPALTGGATISCGCMRTETIRRKYKRTNRFSFDVDVAIGYTQKGEPFYIDRDDYECVKDFCWRKDIDGYIVTTVNRKSLYLHRYLMAAEAGLVVDHLNHDTTDNRRSNLRVVTQSQNMQNTVVSTRNTSTVAGVNWDGKAQKWHSRINVNKQTIELGYYSDFDDAVAARKAGEEKYYGEHSYDNSMAASPVIGVA